MPELLLDEDPARYVVHTEHGDVNINVQELTSALLTKGVTGKKAATPKQMAECVDEVATPESVLKVMSVHSKFALGCRVNVAYDEAISSAGKDSRPSQTSPPPTELSSVDQATPTAK